MINLTSQPLTLKLLRQELDMRQQGPNESVEAYAADIANKCHRLSLNEAEKMNYFIRGLKKELQYHVRISRPATYQEAVELAKLESAIPSESDTQRNERYKIADHSTAVSS